MLISLRNKILCVATTAVFSGAAFCQVGFTALQGISSPFMMINADGTLFGVSGINNFRGFAYGPSIIYSTTDSKYHAYFCSIGVENSPTEWDYVRHAYSNDLVNWITAAESLYPILMPTTSERANCDPSVVYFGGHYYMVYSGNKYNVQVTGEPHGLTENFVAVSPYNQSGLPSPMGPFFKYTGAAANSWEPSPSYSKPIISPTGPLLLNGSAATYGAGQPSLVVMGSAVYQWYTDTTFDNTGRIYLKVSTDMVTWVGIDGTAIPFLNKDENGFPLTDPSVDVKYDENNGVFVMFAIRNQHAENSMLINRVSTDGINWGPARVISSGNSVPPFPHWANNIGISGDDQGHIDSSKMIVASFGAPYDLNGSYTADPLGSWSLYGMRLFSSDIVNVKGNIDGLVGNNIVGWACMTYVPESISVALYLGGPAGTGIGYGTYPASLTSDPAIAAACSTVAEIPFRYSIPVDSAMINSFGGKSIYIHGISSIGGRNNLLSNSGIYMLPSQ